MQNRYAQLKQFNQLLTVFRNRLQEQTLREGNTAYLSEVKGEPRHFISNERNLQGLLDKLNSLPSLKAKDKLNIGFMVGEGHFISCLPELKQHLDVVIMIDLLEPILMHDEFMLETLRKSATPEEFTRAVQDQKQNPIFSHMYMIDGKTTVIDPSAFTTLTKPDIEANPQGHFLGSPERYQLCRQAAEELPVVILPFNLLNPEMAHTLKTMLSTLPHQVNYVHLSNVADYDTDNLPVRDVVKQKMVPGKSQGFKERFNIVTVLEKLLGDNKKYLLSYSQIVPEDEVHPLYLQSVDSVSKFKENRLVFATQIARVCCPWNISVFPAPPLEASTRPCSWQLMSETKGEEGSFFWQNSAPKAFISRLYLARDKSGNHCVSLIFNDVEKLAHFPRFFPSSAQQLKVFPALRVLLSQQQIPWKLLKPSQHLEKCYLLTCPPEAHAYIKPFLNIVNSLESMPKDFEACYQRLLNIEGIKTLDPVQNSKGVGLKLS